MRVGLALPQYGWNGRPISWDRTVGVAMHAERLGFDSVWLSDHLFLTRRKYGGDDAHVVGIEPLVGLTALAGCTSRLALGTLVMAAQYRNPMVLARSTMSIDHVAPGRLSVGIGAGNGEAEFAAAGIAFERPGQRLQQLADALDVLRRETAGSIPLWAGGRGDRFLDVVAGHADGWNTAWAWTPEAYRERCALLERSCERIGRDPATVRRSLGLYALAGEDELDLHRRFERMRGALPIGVHAGLTLDAWRADHLVGTVDELRAQVQVWAGLGVETIIVGAGLLPFADIGDDDDLDVLAAALLG